MAACDPSPKLMPFIAVQNKSHALSFYIQLVHSHLKRCISQIPLPRGNSIQGIIRLVGCSSVQYALRLAKASYTLEKILNQLRAWTFIALFYPSRRLLNMRLMFTPSSSTYKMEALMNVGVVTPLKKSIGSVVGDATSISVFHVLNYLQQRGTSTTIILSSSPITVLKTS